MKCYGYCTSALIYPNSEYPRRPPTRQKSSQRSASQIHPMTYSYKLWDSWTAGHVATLFHWSDQLCLSNTANQPNLLIRKKLSQFKICHNCKILQVRFRKGWCQRKKKQTLFLFLVKSSATLLYKIALWLLHSSRSLPG